MELVQSNKDCHSFSEVCKKRVEMFEAYRAEADMIIAEQDKLVMHHQDELDNINRRNKYLFPGIALLLGIVTGAYLVNREY
jgi:hypothetical protein